MTSLDRLDTGEQGIIHSLDGDKRFLSRAMAMGFVPDTPVIVIRNGRNTPLIVGLRDTKVALGRSQAGNIKIKEIRK